MWDCDVVVIGAGVIGLAVAYELSQRGQEVLVIEKHPDIGWETSSRNSEVIHSGIYYPTGSLKAELCVEGRDRLYQFCTDHDVAYRRCGKLIVATEEEEISALERLKLKAHENGVMDIHEFIGADIKHIEPHVTAVAALYTPITGIIDSHEFMLRLKQFAVSNGAMFAFQTEVVGLEVVHGGYRVDGKSTDGDVYSLKSPVVINAAGLQSDHVARMLGIEDQDYRLHYCKGDYFRVSDRHRGAVKRLIYPVPNPHLTGLGVHATIDLSGGIKLGPDTTYLHSRVLEYAVSEDKRDEFFEAGRRYLPFLEKEDLMPDQSGIRPKLQGPGDDIRDFLIREESDRGLSGFVNLIGIESPGLTSALAIAHRVGEMV